MLKKIIEEKFGSVNKFCDIIDKKEISRQNIYKLISSKKPNPRLSTILALSKVLNVDYLDLIKYFKTKLEESESETTI